MLQIANLEEYTEENIPKLLTLVEPILAKRRKLSKKYTRGASQTATMFSENNKSTVVPLEKFFVDLSTGYNAGQPIYRVNVSKDKQKNEIVNKYLDKPIRDDEYSKAMEVIIDYIARYNDDAQQNYDLIKDIFELTSCYEYIYENEDNEIVYTRFDPLQTVATWDYEPLPNLTGLVRKWTEKDINGNNVTKLQTIDKNKICTYIVAGSNARLAEEISIHNWGDVPGFAVETDFSIFEPAEDVIKAYEQLIQNARNTHEYNDSQAKLKIKGYVPENPIFVRNKDGEMVINPVRQKEDEYIRQTKTFYVQENGDIDWILKPTADGELVQVLKTFSDLSFQLTGNPNTNDLAFNSDNLNASAIDRKFYVLDMFTTSIRSMLKKAYLRRWELVFNRINFKKSLTGTESAFDFRDITVEIPKNLPSNNSEMVDYYTKLDGKLSVQTQLEALGYDYFAEKERIDNETEDNMQKNLERMKLLGQNDGYYEEEMEEDRQDTE